MQYTRQERLEIGRRLYENEITKKEAMAQYGIRDDTARSYMRFYRDANNLPPKENSSGLILDPHSKKKRDRLYNLEDYQNMTKGELITELIEARINEARLKKGYMVKGVGPEREYIRLDSKNTK